MSNKILASPIQISLWGQLNQYPHKSLAVSAIAASVVGELDAPAVENYWQCLLERLEILNTSYHSDEFGALWQTPQAPMAVNFEQLDWRMLAPAEIAAEKHKLYQASTTTSATTPWHKIVLAQHAEGCWLYLQLASLNTDSFSLNYLLEALVEAGSGHSTQAHQRLEQELIQYAELAPWLGDFLVDEALVEARAFWSPAKTINGTQQQFALQNYTGATRAQYDFAYLELGEMYTALADYAALHQASIAEVVCASLRLTFARYSTQGQLTRLFDSRGDESLANAIGPLSRALPLYPTASSDLISALQKEIEMSADGLDYAECFSKSPAQQDTAFAFLFDSVKRQADAPASIEQLVYLSEAFQLQLMLLEQGSQTRLQLAFDTRFIDRASVDYFLACGKADLLNGLAGKPLSRPGYLSIGQRVPRHADETVLSEFEKQVGITPSALVISGDTQLTFAQVDSQANRLAHYLQQAGLGKGDVAGLCLVRSVDFVIAMLAVMKTGAAYIPVDIDLPSQRVASMLQQAEAKMVLCEEAMAFDDCLSINLTQLVLTAYDTTPPAVQIAEQDLAYILFTSGSTGQAKGVGISHKALFNHMRWMNGAFEFHSDDRFLQRTSASFDASIWEFWSPLLVGATLIIAPKTIHYDLNLFKQFISQQAITRLQIVPSLLELFIETLESDYSHQLHSVFCGGEALKTSTALKTQSLLGCEVINLYGPSETCIDATYWRVSESVLSDYVPIGYPIDNLSCRVVKDNGELADKGESGELHIAGDSLFEGYYRRPELTAAAMSYCETTQQSYYRTGDHVRILADGNLMFLERLDDQVKLNGFRIEPEEVAMLVLAENLAEQAKCVFSQELNSLALFFIKPIVSESELLQVLARHLPEYMMPQQLLEVESFPYLSNGKLDKRALIAQAVKYNSAGYVAPSNELESKLAEIWQELLDTPFAIGIKQDFFAIGGHSLLGMKVINRITEEFDVVLSVRVLFEHKTIAELAAYLEPLLLLSKVAEGGEEEMESGLL